MRQPRKINKIYSHIVFDMKHIGIDAGYQNHQAKYTKNPWRSDKTNQSHDNEEHSANHPEVTGQSVGPIPVVLVVKSPRNLDSDRIVLPRFRKKISYDDEKQTHKNLGKKCYIQFIPKICRIHNHSTEN